MTKTNWPPLQINGHRVRAGWARFVDDKRLEISMPALDRGTCRFEYLMDLLAKQGQVEVLWSRVCPPEPGAPKAAAMCGGKWMDPEGFIGRLSCMDVLMTPGDRIDLELTFSIDEKMPTCAYGANPEVGHVLTWDDVKLGGVREYLTVNRAQLRMTHQPPSGMVVTGFYEAGPSNSLLMPHWNETYDVNELAVEIAGRRMNP